MILIRITQTKPPMTNSNASIIHALYSNRMPVDAISPEKTLSPKIDASQVLSSLDDVIIPQGVYPPEVFSKSYGTYGTSISIEIPMEKINLANITTMMTVTTRISGQWIIYAVRVLGIGVCKSGNLLSQTIYKFSPPNQIFRSSSFLRKGLYGF